MASAGPPNSGNSNKMKSSLERFPKSSFITEKAIGQGGFGNVVSGKLNGNAVVVKMLHSPIGMKRYSILEEMSRLNHRNLVTFIGLIETELTECPRLVFQAVHEGSLLDFVRQKNHLNCNKGTLMKLAIDIVHGCEYLHKIDFIHGSLAARNILILRSKSFLNAKISDYGMARVIDGMGANYFKVKNGKTISIRWLPKEAIPDGGRSSEITKASDVWSFGVVLWEMSTLGDTPYGLTVSNTEVQDHILIGSSPIAFKRPDNCTPDIMNIMENIFKVNQADRPTFADLSGIFFKLEEARSKNEYVPKSKIRTDNKQPFSGAYPKQPSFQGAKANDASKDNFQKRNDPRAKEYDTDRSGRNNRNNQNMAGKGNDDHRNSQQEKSHPKDPRNFDGLHKTPSTPANYRDFEKEARKMNPNIPRMPKPTHPLSSQGARMFHHQTNDNQRINTDSSVLREKSYSGSSGFNQGTAPPPPYSVATAQRTPTYNHSTKEKEKLLDTVKSLEEKVAKLELEQKVNKKVDKVLEEKERQQKQPPMINIGFGLQATEHQNRSSGSRSQGRVQTSENFDSRGSRKQNDQCTVV